MRKILSAIILVILTILPAAASAQAEIPDVESLSLEQLFALRAAVDAKIRELEDEKAPIHYESGTYLIGTDMPAGIYTLKEDAYALFPSVIVRADDAAQGALIEYSMVINTAMIALEPGMYVTLTDVIAYPYERETAETALDQNGTAQEGAYWVGAQIPEGTYQISVADKAPLSSYSVYDDIPGRESQLVKFEVIDAPVEISLKSGEYISLSGSSLQLIG